MSKSEKRYFKRFATLNGSGGKAYLSLFDFIERQPSPNDADIKSHFSKESFSTQLHVIKNYLSSLIMKTLRSYHEGKTKNGELKQLLREVEILFERELYGQCGVTINKVIKIASKYERFEALIDAFRWKRQLLQATQGVIKARNEIRDLLHKENQTLKKLENINGLIDLNYSMMENEYGADNKAVLKHPAMKEELARRSMLAFIHHNHIQYAAHAFSGDLKKGLAALDNIILLLERNPHRIQEESSSYITVLNNKIGALLHSRQLDQIPNLLHTIREAPRKYKMAPNREGFQSLLSTYNVELELYRDTHQWEKGIGVINEIKSFLEVNTKHVSAEHQITFYYQFAYIFFKAGDYKNALKYLNEINSGSFTDIRIDIATYARFLNLIIHFELGNIIVLRYSVDSCRRFLLKRRQPQHFEKVLLKFFSKISTEPTDRWALLFHWLKDHLFLKTTETDRVNILDYLNFQSWIEYNIEKQSSPQSPS